MRTETYVYVTTSFIGYHRWATAPQPVAFLRNFHRQPNLKDMAVKVSHGDRDVEFIMLKRELDQYLKLVFDETQFEFSCEQIAEHIIKAVTDAGFAVHSCDVSEDGENGAVVTVTQSE